MDKDFESLVFADSKVDFYGHGGAQGNISDRAYFKEIFSNDKVLSISNPIISKVTGNAVIAIANEVKDSQGNKIGLILTSLKLISKNF